jgi:hypothetical protein
VVAAMQMRPRYIYNEGGEWWGADATSAPVVWRIWGIGAGGAHNLVMFITSGWR